MVRDEKIWVANNEKGEPLFIIPKMVNRHGLVAGATGTGKTVTLKVLAETFSEMGVPVFMADVKGDIAGIMNPGDETENMKERIERFGLSDYNFSYKGFPVTFWDIYGKKGIQVRTTISEMGPLLLSRILGLNDLQTDILNVVFKIADDNNLLLTDTKDLKSILSYVDKNSKEYEEDYGKISSASIGVIVRALVSLEKEGGDVFFGEPALNICDWLTQDNGRGMINILDSSTLINNGKLYSTFLLWMMSELFETLPEVGDLNKPKMVFFFDEAHLLFDDAPKVLLDKIEQMVKLIRSKGVGVYFCTQNPKDIPNGVLSQLGNKVEHGLRAYTPLEQKAVKAAAESFRSNPEFNTYETILSLGTGEAVVSFLGKDGIPGIAQMAYILPPQCNFGTISDSERDNKIKESLLYSKYAKAIDNDSAYEFLQRKGIEDAKAAEEAAQKALEEKEAAKEAEKKAKEEEKKAKQASSARNKAMKTIGNSVVGTVGREMGKSVGNKIGGKFGKTLGGNVGASLGRGLLSTLFKK
jgi:DNA helicase HerA-like ATPase